MYGISPSGITHALTRKGYSDPDIWITRCNQMKVNADWRVLGSDNISEWSTRTCKKCARKLVGNARRELFFLAILYGHTVDQAGVRADRESEAAHEQIRFEALPEIQ